MDNAIFAIILTCGVIVWGVIQVLPGPVIFVIALLAFGAILWILRQVRLLLLKNQPSQPAINIVAQDRKIVAESHTGKTTRESQVNLAESISPILNKMSEVYEIADKYPTFMTKVTMSKDKHEEIYEGITYNGFEFYTGRKILQQYRPIAQLLPPTSNIWALWHAGVLAHSYDIIKRGNIVRLIFPHPENPCIEYLAETLGHKRSDIQMDICRNTRAALERRAQQDSNHDNPIPTNQRIEVRWHKELIGDMITVGNATLNNAWVLLEVYLPNVSLDFRPSIRVSSKPFTELFTHLIEAYEKMWEISKPPTEDDIKKWLNDK